MIGSLLQKNRSSQLSRYFNHKLYDSKRAIDKFVGDNQNLSISSSCTIKDCYKTIRNCEGVICQCCDIITCKPNIPAAKTFINGYSRMHLSKEDKNIIFISRVSLLFSKSRS